MKYAKIYSTKPKQYKFMEHEEAIQAYSIYLACVANSDYDNNLIKAKSFKEWLATEV